MRKPRNKDEILKLIGIKFNKLTLISLTNKKNKNNKGNYFLCQCDCGNMSVVEICKLEAGSTKSCGCYNKERTSKIKGVNLIGKRFSQLIVIKKHSKTKDGMIMWECKCDCGETCYPTTARLNNKTTTSCGKTTHRSSKNSFFWNHNISDEERRNNRRGIFNPENSKFKRLVKEKDGYKCAVKCAVTGAENDLVVHHLFAWKEYPKLRYEINNGITLTKKVHDLFHKIYGRGKNTPEQFVEFVTNYKKGTFNENCIK